MKTLLLACVLLAAVPAAGFLPRPAASAHAAEFDIDAGRAVLRRLQYCVDCGSALLVTDVRAGERVRCPDCGKEQTRLEDGYLLTQLYQICKLCSGPLNPAGHAPGDVVECPVCLTRQPLVADAFLRPGQGGGAGYRPEFPPGSGKKTLLLSPNRPDAAITAVPTDALRDIEEVAEGITDDVAAAAETAAALKTAKEAVAKIPGPPPGFRRERAAEPVAPAAEAPEMSAAPALPELSPASSGAAAPALSDAVNVPAVTADLFGGARPAAGGAAGYRATGDVIARVDGQPMYARDVDLVVLPVLERLKQQTADAAALAAREAELRREVLGRLIDRELAAREAAALGHTPNPAAVREREAELAQILAGSGIDLRREAARDVIMEDMRARFATKLSPVTPKEVREFYQAHKNEMQRPRLLALDQLVVYEDRAPRADKRPAREIAREIAGRLEQGTAFDDLRQRYDEFLPAAALPYAPPTLKEEGMYSRQILAAAGDLREGAVFGPVAAGEAHIFGKVVSVRPAGPPPFTEAENAIRARLESEAAEKAFANWLAGLRARASIEIMEG